MISNTLGTKIAGLVSESGVSDVLINGYSQVWAQIGDGSLRPLDSPFESEAEIAEIAQGLISAGGRRLDQSNPFADVSIGGFRVHAALASGCSDKTYLSIRSHSGRLFGLGQLAELQMFGDLPGREQTLEFLRGVGSRRENFLISGATGSGKTSLLRALLAECAGDRIIALEDVSELGIKSPNFIALQTREANIEGKGSIGLDRLLREALRMRPDRLVVGEVRGAELVLMLQALNTGHRGAGATIHANSLESVASRLEMIAFSAGLSAHQLASSASAAFDWVFHLEAKKLVSIGRLHHSGSSLEVKQVSID